MKRDNRFLHGIASFTALLLLFFCATPARAEMEEGVLIPYESLPAAPEMIYHDAKGAEKTLSSHKGTVVLLHFWATWCPPCIGELGEMAKALAPLEAKGLVVLPVSEDNAMDAVVAFYAKHNIRLPILMDQRMAAMKAFRLDGLPTTLVIDEEGHEFAKYAGAVNWANAKNIQIIESALSAPPPAKSALESRK